VSATDESGTKRRPRPLLVVALITVALLGSGAAIFAAYNANSPSPILEEQGPKEAAVPPAQGTSAPEGEKPSNAKDTDDSSVADDTDARRGGISDKSIGEKDSDDADTTNVGQTPGTTGGSGTSNWGEGRPASGGTSVPQTPGNSGGSGTGTTGNSGKVWHEGWSEWVVDVPGHYEQRLVRIAWDEKIGHYASICNDCGEEVTGNFPAHVIATGHLGGYHTGWILDEIIHHEAIYEDVWVNEQGHSVWHEGYWE
jgi:hypothetical protein